MALLKTGLADCGYRYVNVDDCWAKSRDADGNIQPDTTAFPDFQGMIDSIHELGLLFGLYSDAGNLTCAGRPGSLGYEVKDATTYASWSVDYLKYDNCHNDDIDPKIRYPVMTKALNESGRRIFFSLCEWGLEDPAEWAGPVGNSWRTTGDIHDSWDNMLLNAIFNSVQWRAAGPGGWNDPDMLEVGNGGLSLTESITHFSLWCVMKAPLLIGCDLTSISSDYLAILSNEEMIAINQDPLGRQAQIVAEGIITSVWAGCLENGDIVVLLLNIGEAEESVTAKWEDVFLKNDTEVNVRDLWVRKDLGKMVGSITASVQSHGVVVYRFSPVTSQQTEC